MEQSYSHYKRHQGKIQPKVYLLNHFNHPAGQDLVIYYEAGVDALLWKPKELTFRDQSMKDGAAQVWSYDQ